MQDRPDNLDDAETEGSFDNRMPSSGRQLRRAREEAGVSVDEISHDLHLDRAVVLALESDDYESLGAPVFVRGYLRSYARRLHLDEDDVVAGWQVAEPEAEEFSTHSLQNFQCLLSCFTVLPRIPRPEEGQPQLGDFRSLGLVDKLDLAQTVLRGNT